jgi:hypothetical protein
MKHFFTIAIFFLFQYTICAQFNLTIPGGRIASVTRVEDTLYFWGEDYIWRSTDWGSTFKKAVPFVSFSDSQTGYSQGATLTIEYRVYPWTNYHSFFYSVDYSSNSGINVNRALYYYSPKHQTISNYSFSGSQVAPEYPFSGLKNNGLFVSLDNGYNFKFITENGIKRDVNIGTTAAIPVSDLINYQTYGNGKIIGYRNNDLKIVKVQDSTTTTIQVGNSIKLSKFEFKNIHNGNICLYNKDSSYYYLLNIETYSLTRHNHLVFPFDKSYFYENQILYQKGSVCSVFNFSTGTIDILNNASVNIYNGLYFMGKECIIVVRNSGKSFEITRDLGQTWVTHEDVLTSNRFNTIFDWNHNIYAVREGKLYKTECDSTNKTMEYVHNIGSAASPFLMSYPIPESNCINHNQVLNNMDSVLFCGQYRSIDLGKTWYTLPYEKFRFDYENKQIIAFGENSNHSPYLYKSADLGQTWQEINLPDSLFNIYSTNFTFKGDTIIGGGYRNPDFRISINNGQSFENLIIQNANVHSELLYIHDAEIFSNFVSAGFFVTHSINELYNANYSSGIGLLTFYKNRMGLTYYEHPHFSHKQINTISVGTRKPINYSIGLNAMVLKDRQFGVTDNYLYQESLIYKFANTIVTLSSCEDSMQFQGIMYPIGQNIHTGDSCMIDTVIEVKKLPMIHPVLSACPENIVITSYGGPAIATWTPPTATVDCSGTVVPTSNYQSGATFPGGTTTVVYTARDIQNNKTTCSFTVEVVLVLADLQIDSLDVLSLTTQRGTWLPFKYEVKNAGILDVNENLKVSYYLSNNNSLNYLGVFRGSTTTDSLPINSSLVLFDSIFIPITHPIGYFYLKVKADDNNDIEELNEVNNVIISQNTVKVIKILPDLLIDSLNLPSLTVEKGTWLPFEYEIKNIGTLNVSQNIKISYYISNSNSGSNLGYFLGSKISDSLSINSSLVLSDSIFIPLTQPINDYYLKIKADDSSVIEELDETNNLFVSSDKISVQQNIISSNDEVFDLTFDFILQPNPANDFVNLHFTGLKHNQIDFTKLSGNIVNQLGQIVQHFNFENRNNGDLLLNLSQLSNGVYFIEIENAGQGAMVRKLVVSHK